MTERELEELYDAHAAGLCRYLAAFTRSEADARDLLQELFIKVARLPSREGMTHERAWLYRLAHNGAIDWLRRQKTRQQAEAHLHLQRADVETFQAGPQPDEALLARHFASALQALPEEQRLVMQLKLWEGMTFEEISESQGIPLNTAASRYRYGLEKLRTTLRPLYEELT